MDDSNKKYERYNKFLGNIDNYLFFDKKSLESQMFKEVLIFTDKNQKEFEINNKYLIKEYNKIIEEISKFIKELGLKNNPTSYYVILLELILNGYISRNNQFELTADENIILDKDGYFGLDVINGYGCCRHMVEIFNKVLKYFKFEVYDIQTSFYVTDGKIYFGSKIMDGMGDHASLLIKYNGNYYIYDSVQLFVYKVDNFLVANLYDIYINGTYGECHIKPWSLMRYEHMSKKEVIDLLCSIITQDRSNFISKHEMSETIRETKKICDKNKILMLDFHNQIKPNIDSICMHNYK